MRYLKVRTSCWVLVPLLAFASTCYAEKGWFINNAEIVSVGTFHDGTNSVLQVKFKASPLHVDGSALTCAPTWSGGQTGPADVMTLSWWSDGNPNSTAQARYSTALSAHAQKLPVDLYLDTSRCSATSAKPYGHYWLGIRFSE